MRKSSKVCALAIALSASLAFGAFLPHNVNAAERKGFVSQNVAIEAKNGAFSGWTYYYSNDERGVHYDSADYKVTTAASGKSGNALKLERKTANGKVFANSYAFNVDAGKTYCVSAFVKNVCAESAANGVGVSVKEYDASGAVIVDISDDKSLGSVMGAKGEWTELKFYYTVSNNAAKLALKVKAEGVGEFIVSDITVKESSAIKKTSSYRMLAIGNAPTEENLEDPSIMNNLTEANISSDSSDGDGASLLLNDYDVFKTVFGMLPLGKNYTLSFKYKNLSQGAADRLSIRLDNFPVSAGGNNYYAAGVSGGSNSAWTEYSYEFSSSESATVYKDVQWIGITSYGKYLIDELEITGTDDDGAKMQYIAGGSFAGVCLDEYSYGGNYNFAKQADGTYVFASSAVTRSGKYNKNGPNVIFPIERLEGTDTGERGYLRLDNATNALTSGKTYVLSFEYRSGGSEAGDVYYGIGWGDKTLPLASILKLSKATESAWVKKEVEFTFTSGAHFEIYGDAGIGWPTYFKNFQITDKESGKTYIKNQTLVAPDVVLGNDVFPYGKFEGETGTSWSGWTAEGNAEISGLKFENGTSDWRICLNGGENQPASMISEQIDVSCGTIAIDKEVCCGEVTTSLILSDGTELFAEDNGLFELKEGVSFVKIKFTANAYASVKNVKLSTHTHTAGEIVEVTPTCSNKGGKYYHCEGCDTDIWTEVIIVNHEFVHDEKAATCIDKGYTRDVCKNCSAVENYVEIPATGVHSYKKVLIDATCTTPGIEKDVCEFCGDEKNFTPIPAGHKYDEHGKCTVCGETDPDFVEPDDPVVPDPDKPDDNNGGCGSSLSGSGLFAILIALGMAILFKRRKTEL